MPLEREECGYCGRTEGEGHGPECPDRRNPADRPATENPHAKKLLALFGGGPKHLLDAALAWERRHSEAAQGAAPRAEGLPPITADSLARAEHFWCVQVDGEFALRHDWTAHRAQATYILARLSRPSDEREGESDDR